MDESWSRDIELNFDTIPHIGSLMFLLLFETFTQKLQIDFLTEILQEGTFMHQQALEFKIVCRMTHTVCGS